MTASKYLAASLLTFAAVYALYLVADHAIQQAFDKVAL